MDESDEGGDPACWAGLLGDDGGLQGYGVEVRPVAIHHVSINVRDVDTAVDFYTDVLGATVRDDRPDFGFGGAWLDIGGQQLHLIEGEVPPALGQHLAVQVHDLDTVVAELRAKGIDVRDPSPVGRSRQTFVDDPSGNLVELHEAGGAG